MLPLGLLSAKHPLQVMWQLQSTPAAAGRSVVPFAARRDMGKVSIAANGCIVIVHACMACAWQPSLAQLAHEDAFASWTDLICYSGMHTLDMSCTCRSKSRAPGALVLSRAASLIKAASRSSESVAFAWTACQHALGC